MIELFDIPNLISTYGYLGIFIVVFLESGIFFALPGDSLLFTAGFIASTGFLKIYYLVPIIFISGTLGSFAGYFIGIHLNKLQNFSFFRRILKKEHLEKTHLFFEKHGHYAIILSRFIPIIRTFTPIIAGIAKMNFKSFVKYNILGALIWSTSMTFIGFFLGQIFPWIKDYISFLIIWVVFISILPILIPVLRKKKK